jgi:pimeloyl-ACP methyl ester carboxylesterase
MGGYLAFEMWRQAPDRIAKLGLLDTSARPERPEQSAVRDEHLAMVRAGRFAEMSEEWFPTFMHRSLRNDPALRGEIRLMNAEVGAEAYVRQQQAIRGRADFRPDLKNIDCPTLVLVGDSDEGTTPEMAREMADGIRGARLVIVPECGHLSTMERPDAVNKALVEWLGG